MGVNKRNSPPAIRNDVEHLEIYSFNADPHLIEIVGLGFLGQTHRNLLREPACISCTENSRNPLERISYYHADSGFDDERLTAQPREDDGFDYTRRKSADSVDTFLQQICHPEVAVATLGPRG
jgi:hypothetical protein